MKYDISALGNALVDTQYKVSHEFLSSIGMEPDSMTLASAEEQNPIIEKLIEMGSESVSDCGGSATNSLVAASNYGSKCHHVCRVAADKDGENYLDSLRSAGVDHIGVSNENTDMPTGKCLILVTPDAKRTMISMLGVSAYLGSSDIDYDVVENSKIFYIEGYMVTSDENFSAVISVLEHLKGKDVLKALSLSDAGIVHGFKDKFDLIESYGIDMIFCNDDEAVAFAMSTKDGVVPVTNSKLLSPILELPDTNILLFKPVVPVVNVKELEVVLYDTVTPLTVFPLLSSI